MNVLGPSGWIDWRGADDGTGIDRILDQARKMRAVVVMNHPFGDPSPDCTGCRWAFQGVVLSSFDAVEVWNSEWRSDEVDNPRALTLWEDLLDDGHRITALAGSDAHAASDYARRRLPFACVWATGLTERRLLDGVRAGRAVLTSGPTLRMYRIDGGTGRERRILPGSVLPNADVTLRVRIEGAPSGCRLWLIVDREPRWSTRLPVGSARLDLPEVVPLRWGRLEIRRGDDLDGQLLLLSNPLYAQAAPVRRCRHAASRRR